MPLRLRRFTFLALITLAFFGHVGRAQEKSSADKASSVRRADPHILTLDFPGGPLSNFTAAMIEKGVPFSLINPDHLDPELPAFSVHDENTDSIIMALGRLIEPQGYELGMVSRTLAILKRNGENRDASFAAFQLASKLDQFSIADITAAINTACEFSNPAQKPPTLRFKYHPGTKLLFIAGSRREIDIASQVIGSLPNRPSIPDPRNPQPSTSSDKK